MYIKDVGGEKCSRLLLSHTFMLLYLHVVPHLSPLLFLSLFSPYFNFPISILKEIVFGKYTNLSEMKR